MGSRNGNSALAEGTVGLRLDRTCSVYVMGPLLRAVSRGAGKIPILMYHSVAEEDESATHPYYWVAVRPSLFREQMAWLHEHGYQTVTLEGAVSRLRGTTQDTARPVVITFDDGYRNFLESAFPALQEYGFSATMFLPTNSIGTETRSFKGRDCLTWKEVRELRQQGIEFGSHTVSHPQLHDLPPHRIREEILTSRQAIEDNLGCAVDTFAYPYAFPQSDGPFKAMVREILEEGGYRYGVCTQIGRASRGSDPLFLERLPMNGGDDTALLGAKMAGAYDWVGVLQAVVKGAQRSKTKARPQK